VKLVTVLKLKETSEPANSGGRAVANGGDHESHASASGASTASEGGNGKDRSKAPTSSSAQHEGRAPGRPRYLISSQEDLYQVNEFLKFTLPAIGAPVWFAWQILSTVLCVVGMFIMLPVMKLLESAGLVQQQKLSA
jgi:hypothetical protein